MHTVKTHHTLHSVLHTAHWKTCFPHSHCHCHSIPFHFIPTLFHSVSHLYHAHNAMPVNKRAAYTSLDLTTWAAVLAWREADRQAGYPKQDADRRATLKSIVSEWSKYDTEEHKEQQWQQARAGRRRPGKRPATATAAAVFVSDSSPVAVELRRKDEWRRLRSMLAADLMMPKKRTTLTTMDSIAVLYSSNRLDRTHFLWLLLRHEQWTSQEAKKVHSAARLVYHLTRPKLDALLDTVDLRFMERPFTIVTPAEKMDRLCTLSIVHLLTDDPDKLHVYCCAPHDVEGWWCEEVHKFGNRVQTQPGLEEMRDWHAAVLRNWRGENEGEDEDGSEDEDENEDESEDEGGDEVEDAVKDEEDPPIQKVDDKDNDRKDAPSRPDNDNSESEIDSQQQTNKQTEQINGTINQTADLDDNRAEYKNTSKNNDVKDDNNDADKNHDLEPCQPDTVSSDSHDDDVEDDPYQCSLPPSKRQKVIRDESGAVRLPLPRQRASTDWEILVQHEARQRQNAPSSAQRSAEERAAFHIILATCAEETHYTRDMCQSAMIYFDRFRASAKAERLDVVTLAWVALSLATKLLKTLSPLTIHPLAECYKGLSEFHPDLVAIAAGEPVVLHALGGDLYCITPARWLWWLISQRDSRTLNPFVRASQLIDYLLWHFTHTQPSLIALVAYDIVYLQGEAEDVGNNFRRTVLSFLHLDEQVYNSFFEKARVGASRVPVLPTITNWIDPMSRHHQDQCVELANKVRLTLDERQREQQLIDPVRIHERQLFAPSQIGVASAEQELDKRLINSIDQVVEEASPVRAIFDEKQLLGKGAHCCVYRVDDKAVKVLSQFPAVAIGYGVTEETIRELAMQVAVGGEDNTVCLESISSDATFITQPLAKGTLYQYIKQGRVESFSTIKHIFKQVCQAVRRCHSFGIMHRDVKPDNILLMNFETKHFVLADFGSSMQLGYEQRVHTRSFGTPGYVAPEVAHTQMYTTAVDIWSLGVVLWWMCTRTKPDVEETLGRWRATIRYGDGELVELSDPKSSRRFGNPKEVRQKMKKAIHKSLQMTELEKGQVLDVLTACLTYDMFSRATADELLFKYAFGQ